MRRADKVHCIVGATVTDLAAESDTPAGFPAAALIDCACTCGQNHAFALQVDMAKDVGAALVKLAAELSAKAIPS